MRTIGFYLFYGINWVFTLLPLSVLYLFADLLFPVLYYFPSYRRKVVATNLKNAFPEKSPEELHKIERNFYKHLSDVIIETTKLTHMSAGALKKRITVDNPEIIQKIKDEGRDIVGICGHYNNWEWMASFPLFTDINCVSVYKPLEDKLFDSFMNNLRVKYGMALTPMSHVVRETIINKKKGINSFYAFIADQTPAKGDINYWTQFLNQETPVYLGAEKIAAKYDMALVFFNHQKIKRGFYKMKVELLFEHTAGLPDHIITDTHVRRFEEIIIEKPQYWIWSHRRWKHKKEQPDG